ncbi:integral membrane sensor signal transduction histidine kinase [[Leptolyngbya] sp. PCC 7376]|uniref:sensor histidine kinase n=1 Tax=[Leptolyngbya] sp. PCC 7376 TaxID=111781 RepID=UPI00029F024B|nr:ATP-binding protein [[Leptolyngbya] sp. PCC 7376]AFY37395.1 integral membrane sensor signal transduction histidine kinase [[Leptolyngbya] sp. PCC 7376]
MKLSSFRLRIALFAALLASVAVSGFGGISYILLYQSKTQNLDQDLQARLIRDASRPRSDQAWQTLEESRELFFSDDLTANSLVLVYGTEQTLIYQSANWDNDLNSYLTFPPQPDLPNNFPINPRRPNLPGNRDTPRRPPNPEIIQELIKLSSLTTQHTSTGSWRLGTVSSPFVQMAIAINLDVIDQEMALIRNIFVLLIPATLVIVMAGAWWLSSNALSSVQNITSVLKKITAKGLDQRASSNGLDTEFLELVNVFNQMMERLERSFQQASRFSGDAAHELKTPLAILQGELEQAMQTAPAGSSQQQTFGRLLDEIRRLNSITRKLLLLSLADAGQMKLQSQTIDFSELVSELAEDIELMAPELQLQLQLAPNLKLKGDRQLLTQVLQNLVTNAIKYNVPQGLIAIETFQAKQNIILKISNPSKGLKGGDRQKIFERFKREDSSHNRKVEGFGLGLSLSREIVRAHGGELTLEPASKLVTFTLSLPISMAR